MIQKIQGAKVLLPNLWLKLFNENNRKLYLGGYRSRKTGLVYHHGSTQTLREVVQQTGPENFTRECQTAIEVTRSAQTKRENGTQMKRNDIYLMTKTIKSNAKRIFH